MIITQKQTSPRQERPDLDEKQTHRKQEIDGSRWKPMEATAFVSRNYPRLVAMLGLTAVAYLAMNDHVFPDHTNNKAVSINAVASNSTSTNVQSAGKTQQVSSVLFISLQ